MKVLVFITILVSLSACKAQTAQKLTGKTNNNIDPSIWVIHQDALMNYWFGSNGKGVFRWNGHTVSVFTIRDGLYSNHIRGIQEDSRGNIFIDTPEGVSKLMEKKL